MNAALMWTINVFPAYEMVSSWNTYEKLTCPYYTENNKALTLTNNGKMLFYFIFANGSCQMIKSTERI
jgi:hypothetical protein